MTNDLKIVVLISAGRHPVTGAPRACRGDAVALSFAQALAPATVSVFFAGEANDAALIDYLALGAGHISVIPTPREDDVTPHLVEHLREFDIIITGVQSETGAASGLLPYLLAAQLGRPIMQNIVSASHDNRELQLKQYLPKGVRRRIAATLPVVLTIHPTAAIKLSYAYARGIAGRLTVLPEVVDTPSGKGIDWIDDNLPRRPQPLMAERHQNGHDRMQAYISAPSRSGRVVLDGSSVDKAQILFTYLREHRLIDL